MGKLWDSNGKVMTEFYGKLWEITSINHITGWWFHTFFIFHNIWDVILPIDELIFFRGVGIPPTR